MYNLIHLIDDKTAVATEEENIGDGYGYPWINCRGIVGECADLKNAATRALGGEEVDLPEPRRIHIPTSSILYIEEIGKRESDYLLENLREARQAEEVGDALYRPSTSKEEEMLKIEKALQEVREFQKTLESVETSLIISDPDVWFPSIGSAFRDKTVAVIRVQVQQDERLHIWALTADGWKDFFSNQEGTDTSSLFASIYDHIEERYENAVRQSETRWRELCEAAEVDVPIPTVAQDKIDQRKALIEKVRKLRAALPCELEEEESENE